MKAMMSNEPGGPQTLVWSDLQDPVPGKGELLIEIKAAGVNFPDTLIIQDLYQMKPPRPFAPGGEIAGVVAALGEGVEGFSIGDRILALTGHGGFATHAVIDAARAITVAWWISVIAPLKMLFGRLNDVLYLNACSEAGW